MPNRIKFFKINSPEPVVNHLCQRIEKRVVRGLKVLWLVPGGSAIKIAVSVAEKLAHRANLECLTISLTDERYGVTGHSNSNWKQLMDSGFVMTRAVMTPVLVNESLTETVKSYDKKLRHALNKADYSLALAGLGPDGHIFGIKPHSPSISTQERVIGYKWDDFERITPAFNLIKLLDEVVIYAVGEEKHHQIELLEHDIAPTKQPAQLLKKLPRVTIFNDYKGESV